MKVTFFHSRTFFRLLSALLMILGIAWVIYLFATTVDDPRQFIPANLSALIVATLFVAISFATNWFLFHIFLCSDNIADCSVTSNIRIFTAGQLLRYLPGKVWGIIYQIAETQGKFSAGRIMRANIDLMIFSLSGNCVFACFILGFKSETISLYFFGTGTIILICQALFFLVGASWVLSNFSALLPKKLRNYISTLAANPPRLTVFILMQFVFAAGWVFYLLGWRLLGIVFPAFAETDFVALAIFYTLASIIGIASFITPAGIGVREAVFIVFAASSVGGGAASFFAAFGRFWLMFVDVLLLIVVSLFHVALRKT